MKVIFLSFPEKRQCPHSHLTAKTVMVQGTASSVGKSLIAAALCRIFARSGLKVAPFKSQNMSNNAAALPDGSEIGRAQYLQALAARAEPRVEMNPILLKPESDARSQVILMGKPYRTLGAMDYYRRKEFLWAMSRRLAPPWAPRPPSRRRGGGESRGNQFGRFG